MGKTSTSNKSVKASKAAARSAKSPGIESTGLKRARQKNKMEEIVEIASQELNLRKEMNTIIPGLSDKNLGPLEQIVEPEDINIIENNQIGTANTITTIQVPFSKTITKADINVYYNFFPAQYNDTNVAKTIDNCRSPIPIGKDAALANVVDYAKAYIDCLKSGTYIDPKLNSNNVEDDDDDADKQEQQEKKGRAGVKKKWKDALSGTQSFKTLTKALIGNLAFVKAIMDSACLGETVSISLLKSLCGYNKTQEYNTIIPTINIKSLTNIYNNYGAEGNELLNFLLEMSSIDVFELVSSDVLGAVNSCYTIRAIHDTLPFVSYVSIPKASGGQIGTDVDVFIFALIISNMLNYLPQLPFTIDNIEHFFNINEGKNIIMNHLLNIYGTNVPEEDIFNKFIQDINDFRNNQNYFKGGIIRDFRNVNNNIIGNYFRITQCIKGFGEIFYSQKNGQVPSVYTNIYNEIQNSYNSTGVVYTQLPEDIVWLSFQILRYIQVLRFKNNDFDNTFTTWFTEWYKALQKVAINEAFAGHDNKSIELLNLGIQVYEEQLGWTQTTDKKGNAKISGWDSIEKVLIKNIQKQTKCMFFQYTPISGTNKRGVLFSTNTNLVYNRMIGQMSAPTASTVCELFIDNIGSQRIISTYDLENYEGDTVMSEKYQSKSLCRDLVESLVTKFRENSKILEIQGVICTLDRASRISHPNTIYCSGLLNIPFTYTNKKDNNTLQTTLSYEVVSQNIPISGIKKNEIGFRDELYGLKDYKLYYELVPQTNDICSELNIQNGRSPDITNILCFVSEIYSDFLAADKKAFMTKITNNNYKQASVTECNTQFKKTLIDINKTQNAVLTLNAVEYVMRCYYKQDKGAIWLKTFSYLACTGNRSTGNAIMNLNNIIVNDEDLNNFFAMNSGIVNIFNSNQQTPAFFDSTNIPFISGDKLLTGNNIGLFIRIFGFQIGKLNNALNQIQPSGQNLIFEAQNMVPQQQITNLILDTQKMFTNTELIQLRNATLLPNNQYGISFEDEFTKGYLSYANKIQQDINSNSTLNINGTQFQQLSPNFLSQNIHDTVKIAYLTDFLESVKYMTLTIHNVIQNNPNSDNINVLIGIKDANLKLMQTIQQELNKLQLQIQNMLFAGFTGFTGGQPQQSSNLNNLDGKLVIYKYDKTNNMCYIADYEQVLKSYFENIYGESREIETIKNDTINYIKSLLHPESIQTNVIRENIPGTGMGLVKSLSPGQEGQVRRLINQGLTEEEAKKRVLSEKWQQTPSPGPVISKTNEKPRFMTISDIRKDTEPAIEGQNIQYVTSSTVKNRGGKIITRKRRFNKLTRKKRKQMKARKTHHRAKNHRYTRHK